MQVSVDRAEDLSRLMAEAMRSAERGAGSTLRRATVVARRVDESRWIEALRGAGLEPESIFETKGRGYAPTWSMSPCSR